MTTHETNAALGAPTGFLGHDGSGPGKMTPAQALALIGVNGTGVTIPLAVPIAGASPLIDFTQSNTSGSWNLERYHNNEASVADFSSVLAFNAGNDGATRRDNVYSFGYNIDRNGKQVSAEHQFYWTIENFYRTSQHINQLEFYFTYENAATTLDCRPFGITPHLADDYVDVNFSSSTVRFTNRDQSYQGFDINVLDDTTAYFRLHPGAFIDFEGTAGATILSAVGSGLITSPVAASGVNARMGLFLGSQGGNDELNLFYGGGTHNAATMTLMFGAPARLRGIKWDGNTGHRQFEYQRDDGTWHTFDENSPDQAFTTYLTRTPGTTAADAIEIGNIGNIGSGSLLVELSLHVFSTCDKKYVFTAKDGDLNDGNWYQLMPLVSSGGRGGNDYEIDVKNSSNVYTFRARHTVSSGSSSPCEVVIEVLGDYEAGTKFNATTTTSSGTSVSGFWLNNPISSINGYCVLSERSGAPSAPAANQVALYAVDNGSGKTQLMALFSSGAAQQIAIQP